VCGGDALRDPEHRKRHRNQKYLGAQFVNATLFTAAFATGHMQKYVTEHWHIELICKVGTKW
jgi:hypothetical protein